MINTLLTYLLISLGTNVDSPYFTSSTIEIDTLRLSHDGIVLQQIRPDFTGRNYTLMYHNFVNFVCGSLGGAFMVTFNDFKNGHRWLLIVLFSYKYWPIVFCNSLVDCYWFVMTRIVFLGILPLIYWLGLKLMSVVLMCCSLDLWVCWWSLRIQ